MKYFSISEMLYSSQAVQRKIWNGCTLETERNLIALIENVLDPARQAYGNPVFVNSGYRCPKVNGIVGGANNSQHVRGEAADITTRRGLSDNLKLAKIIVKRTDFDQIILEGSPKGELTPDWIHVSYRRDGNNRHEILKQVKGVSGYFTVSREEVLKA